MSPSRSSTNRDFSVSYRITDRKDTVYDHCLMMIACGKWPVGMRLPSIRDAEKEWGVNRSAIQQAYKKLASQNIVLSKARSGYYVAGQEGIQRISDHRVELENLYQTFSDSISEVTGLAPLPVLRYLTKLAQIRDKETPQCVFVECTRIQAETHAREIVERLKMAVLPMTVMEISGRKNRIPNHVGKLFTTHFHSAQMMPLDQPGELEVVVVPIEVSPRIVEMVKQCRNVLLLIEREMQTARTVACDVGELLGRGPIEIRVVSRIGEALEDLLEPSGGTKGSDVFALVSPHEWNGMDPRWRSHPNVELVPFRIREEAWDLIADVLGMPLGGLG